MNQPPDLSVAWLILVALALSAALWAWMADRRSRGLTIVRYQPRRSVPWGGLDVLAVVLVFFALAGIANRAIHQILGPELTQFEKATDSTGEHFVARLAEGGGWAFLLAGVSAVVVAPIFEELFFRVILQGWLEKAERRWRRAFALRRMAPRGTGPIVFSSLLFAAMHFRIASDQVPQYQHLIAMAVGNMAVGVLTTVFALALLRFRAGATAADLGWAPRRLAPDIFLGVAGFLALAGPLYVVLFVSAVAVKPLGIAADPLPIFVLALGLGTLYYRTHRVVPSVAMHMTLNAITLALLWVGMAK